MQPCKTGDQPYSDASPYSECSLTRLINFLYCNFYLLTLHPFLFENSSSIKLPIFLQPSLRLVEVHDRPVHELHEGVVDDGDG